MNSFLVVGGTRTQRKEKALYFAKSYNVSKFDINIIEPDKDASIGIGQIREIKTSLAFKPFNSPFKLALILDFEKSTVQAQNAFLKTLEEPPRNTIIVLTAPNTDLLLPTIVSRCQVIKLVTDNKLANAEFRISNFARPASLGEAGEFRILVNGGLGDKLKLAESHGKTREEALAFLEGIIINTRRELIDDILKSDNHLVSLPAQAGQYLNILISFHRTHTELSTTNISPRLTLETLLLNLP